ncbi:hypothetical protein AC1031_021672 [Aphanomyces cochlioides]|nr:hypothetical protein AC1031_021672 [Aphanomyces cochlioides]
MQLVVGALLAANVMVAVSSAAPCKPADITAVYNSTFLSPYFGPCAKDIGVTPSALQTLIHPTPSQLATAKDSDNCQWLFGDFQTIANESSVHCMEIDLLVQNVSFDMFLTWVDVESVAKVSSPCNASAITSALASAASSSSHAMCLEAAGLNTTAATFVYPPTLDQITAIRNNDLCTGLFTDLQAVIANVSSCALLADGTDIQALARLDFDGAMDWLEIVTSLDGPPPSNTVRFPAQDESLHHGAAVVLGAMLAGTCVAIVVYVVHLSSTLRKTSEERQELLAI